jgi:hypothetical protein
VITVRFIRRGALTAVAVVLVSLSLGSGHAFAALPWWHLNTISAPADSASGEGRVVVEASNLGDTMVNGFSEPVTVVDKLPAGVTPTHVYGEGGGGEVSKIFPEFLMTCSFASQTVTCTYAGPLLTYERLMIAISVKVTPGDGNGENELSLSGGGATSAVLRRALALGDPTSSFGVENYELTPEEEGGAVDTQAGSHPFQLTTTLTLNTNAVTISNYFRNETLPEVRPLAYTKDLRFNLPPGLIGNPTPLPKCNMHVFLELK